MGEPCRYDAKAVLCPEVGAYLEGRTAIPVCPEQFGGLSTPRTPAERQPNGRVVNADGVDVTEAFETGAAFVVALACELGCDQAILKDKSPSCGVHAVYDGTFSGKLVVGKGITAEALEAARITVVSENDIKRSVPPCE